MLLTNVMKIDFERDIKPILETGGPLSDKKIEILKLWLDQGAVWPKDIKLGADRELALVTDLQKRILAMSKESAEADMKKYTDVIPGSTVTFDMVPIAGGSFTMGSPDSEPNRKPDEGPQHQVKISPFWMGRCEVTWDEYELFMYPEQDTGVREVSKTELEAKKLADAITHPTRPYVEMSFGMGKSSFPAISMTQHGANKYCQWLSAKTGHFYRLPTEAEWEYAARAGTTTAYFFGDDPAQPGDYAWFEQNSDFKYQKVGKKKPNPWGLCDIYGNVTEWVLDQYDPNYYKQFGNSGPIADPWNKATKPYPHAARGGSWKDDPTLCRSAARLGSEPSWKMQDPQLPKSVWYFTDAQFVGFRVVRPLKIPTAEEMKSYWNSGVEKE
jgi:formylglycine-generating enzyme required for sulfatase activity